MQYSMKFTCEKDFREVLKRYSKRRYLYKGISLLIQEQKILDNMNKVKDLSEKIKELKQYAKFIKIGLSELDDKEKFIIEQSYFKNKSCKEFAKQNNYTISQVCYKRSKVIKKLFKYSYAASQEENEKVVM